MTESDNEWQGGYRVVILANVPSFRIRHEPTTLHPEENFLNIKKNLEERLLN